MSTNASLHTLLCDRLNIRWPIIQAPMAGGIVTPELVAVVSHAGGLGSFAASRLTTDQIRSGIRAIKAQTDRPFAVNFLIAPPEAGNRDVATAQAFLDQFRTGLGLPAGKRDLTVPPSPLNEQIQMVIDERVPILSFALGDPSGWVASAHTAGTQVIAMVTTVAEAVHVANAGVDVVVAQGAEAGGHRSTFTLGLNHKGQLIGGMALVPQIVDAVIIPVVAAGGIMDGRGLVAALALGASGAQLGTRFLLARESGTVAAYRQRLLNATEADTVITRVTSGRPTRSVRNRLIDAYRENGIEPLAWPLQGLVVEDIFRAALQRGDADCFPLQAGQGLRMLKDNQSAPEIVLELVAEAHEALARVRGLAP